MKINIVSRRWFNNSVANMIAGVGAAIFNLMLPALLVRYLSTDDFSIWSLSIQTIIYINIIGLGLQTATARFVAIGVPSIDCDDVDVSVEAANSLAKFSSCVAIVLVIGLVFFYPYLFPNLPDAFRSEFRITIALVGASAALQIMALVPMGYFQGIHRNIVYVLCQISVRVLALVAVYIGIQLKYGLIYFALVLSISTILIWPLVAFLYKKSRKKLINPVNMESFRERRLIILKYCGTLSVWAVSMLLVNSVGMMVVGRWDYSMIGPYSISVAGSAVVGGVINAILSPALTTVASMYGDDVEKLKISGLLYRITKLCVFGLNIGFLLFLVLKTKLLMAWVGSGNDVLVMPIITVLIASQCIRNVAAPYAIVLLGTGLNKYALLSGVIEGIVNLIATIIFGFLFGAIGAAYGSMMGALAGVLYHAGLNFVKIRELTPRPMNFIYKSFIIPMLTFLPLYFFIYEYWN